MLKRFKNYLIREKNILCKKVKPTDKDYQIAYNLIYVVYAPIAAILSLYALSKINNLTDQKLLFYFSLFITISVTVGMLFIDANTPNDT